MEKILILKDKRDTCKNTVVFESSIDSVTKLLEAWEYDEEFIQIFKRSIVSLFGKEDEASKGDMNMFNDTFEYILTDDDEVCIPFYHKSFIFETTTPKGDVNISAVQREIAGYSLGLKIKALDPDKVFLNGVEQCKEQTFDYWITSKAEEEGIQQLDLVFSNNSKIIIKVYVIRLLLH